jgi:hypothetical protein
MAKDKLRELFSELFEDVMSAASKKPAKRRKTS